jgi:hypothetical protein
MKPGEARDKFIKKIEAKAAQQGGFCGVPGLKFNPNIRFQ